MKAFKYLAAIATLAAVGCVHQAEQPPLSGPSDFALSMTVTTSPQTITQNGSDKSVITAKVYYTDSNGQTRPKANLPIRFDMQVNGVLQDYGTLGTRSAATDANGVAQTQYTAPPMPNGGTTGAGCNGVPGQCITIVATTTDTAAANNSTSSATATIALVPQGVILPPAGSPTAAFTITPTPVGQGSAVTFDASASVPGNGAASIASYSWSFGDGATGTGSTVSHTYNTAATFQVTLTVTNDRGLSASTTQPVNVGAAAAPVADFVYSPQAPSVGQTIVFDADTAKAGTGRQLTAFNWNFGDGTTASGLVVSHSFTAAGAYNVVLSVTDDIGQKSTKTNLVNVAAPTGGGGGGGGGLAASFTFSPATPGLNQDVFFNATSSTAASGHSIVSYSWDFGDGSQGNGVTTTHQYTRAGTFVVTLVVKDDLNQTATGKTNVTIANTSSQIVAAFNFSPQNPSITGGTNTVFFDATASTPSPGASITAYVWTWGDGTAAGSGITPSHLFTRAGQWVVRLTITDSLGNTATTTQTVSVAQ